MKRPLAAPLVAALLALSACRPPAADPGRDPADLPVPAPPAAPSPVAPATGVARPAPRGRFLLAGRALLDLTTLEKKPLPDDTLVATLAGGLLIVARGSTLRALDPETGAELWSSPIVKEIGLPEALVANGERLFVLGNPRHLAIHELATGKRIHDEPLVDTGGLAAPHEPRVNDRGLAFLLGDTGAFFAQNNGPATTLNRLPEPQGASHMRATTLSVTEAGACVQYWAPKTWQALRCFDARGYVTWDRPWVEERFFLAQGSPRHLLLTTQGHLHDDAPRTLVLSAESGAVEFDQPRASGALLEDAGGAIDLVLSGEPRRIAAYGRDGTLRWEVPYPFRGLVTAARSEDGLVLLAHPLVPDATLRELRVVHVDAAGRARWTTAVPIVNGVEHAVGAVSLRVVRDRVIVQARSARGGPLMASVLSLAEGKLLASLP
ncbi:MAG: PQQ-binding-like beta-propeller repeat protein [Byssovorax sp.]